MMPRPARLVALPALVVLALASPAAPASPPVFASKALRVELTGTAEALWRFVPRSAAPGPGLRRRRSSRSTAGSSPRRSPASSRVGDPIPLRPDVFEHRSGASLRDDPSLALEVRFRLSEDGPIVRFQYRLTATRPHAFSRSGARGRARVPRHDLRRPAPGPGGAPLRVRRAPPQLHALRARRARLRTSRRGLGVMGPILAASDGKRTLLLAYEHGSQAPDAFLRFDLAPGRTRDAARGEGQLLARPGRRRRAPVRHRLDAGRPRGRRRRQDGRGLPRASSASELSQNAETPRAPRPLQHLELPGAQQVVERQAATSTR